MSIFANFDKNEKAIGETGASWPGFYTPCLTTCNFSCNDNIYGLADALLSYLNCSVKKNANLEKLSAQKTVLFGHFQLATYPVSGASCP